MSIAFWFVNIETALHPMVNGPLRYSILLNCLSILHIYQVGPLNGKINI